MVHAVRALEQTGPLDDAQAMAEAFARHTHPQARLRERAWLLGQRLGLPAQMARWRDAAWWLGAALAVAVVLMANGMVFAILAQGRSIHAGSALVAALGVHLVTLGVWLATLVLAPRWPGAWGRWSLGALLLRVLAWWPADRTAPSPLSAPLATGARQMLRQARLAPWGLGLVSHLVWAASFVWVLLGLLGAFAFREYRLTWESTIFDPAFFQALVQASGWLPAQLGFAVPDGAVCMAGQMAPAALAAGPDACTRAAAWWLLGCVAVYGLLPRLLCAAWCAGVWQRRKNRLALDTADSYLRQLLARWDAMAPAYITDPEPLALPGATSAPGGSAPDASAHRSAIAWIGFELPQAQAWPPPQAASAAQSATLVAEVRSGRDAVAVFATAEAGRAALLAELERRSARVERFLARLGDIANDTAIDLGSATPDLPTLTPTPSAGPTATEFPSRTPSPSPSPRQTPRPTTTP